jgi:hypothetical protein
VGVIHAKGWHSGRLFNHRLKIANKLQEFENNFFMVLQKVQANTNFLRKIAKLGMNVEFLEPLRGKLLLMIITWEWQFNSLRLSIVGTRNLHQR